MIRDFETASLPQKKSINDKRLYAKCEKKSFQTKAPSWKKFKPKLLYLYGLHTVRAALNNPARKIRKLLATHNGLQRLDLEKKPSFPFEMHIVESRDISRITGQEAAHQGVLVEVLSLETPSLEICQNYELILALDRITDPQNTGAIMRSAMAFGAQAMISPERHCAKESAALAKAASGALEHIPHITVKNLAHTLEKLHIWGFSSIGLDSGGESDIENSLSLARERVVLVFGAEGRGLRVLTRKKVNLIAHLETREKMPSLNVSNAAAIAMYVTRQHLDRQG